ncbi:MAG: hypothetical protein ACI39R_00355 [Lachnospiraceae bacterium]
MKKIYKDEQSGVFKICLIIVALILISTISMLAQFPPGIYENFGAPVPEMFTAKWFIILLGPVFFCVIILVFGSAFSKSAFNFKKWKQYLMKNGRKCTGYVTDIEIRSGYDHDGRYRTSYRYKVSYVDPDTEDMKTFTTPVLIKVNQNIAGATCDVYVAPQPTDIERFQDRSDELIRVNNNNIQMTLNPIKLAGAAYHNTAKKGWLGDEIAVDFIFYGNAGR